MSEAQGRTMGIESFRPRPGRLRRMARKVGGGGVDGLRTTNLAIETLLEQLRESTHWIELVVLEATGGH